MTPQEELKKQVKASLGTTGVCALVLLIMMLTSAWDTAQSGLGDGTYGGGIEVNLGDATQGSGDDQPMTPTGNPNATDTENPPAQEEAAPAPAPAESTPAEAKAEASETFTAPKSDGEIKDVKKDVKPVEKTPEKKITEKPADKPVEKPVEKPREVNPQAVYQPKKSGNTASPGNGEGKKGSAGSEGDDEGKVGDKGVLGGTPGANVYTGKPGTGGGGSGGLDLNGWTWEKQPSPVSANNESGRVVFEIVVNEDGELESVKTLEKTVSNETEQACRREVQKVSFSKTGTNVPQRSVGRVTFVFTSK